MNRNKHRFVHLKTKKKSLNDMFHRVGVNHEDLLNALKQMGQQYLKNSAMKKTWSPENPTRNYCYVVSEFVYWYLSPPDSTVWSLRISGQDTLHWFVKWPNEAIIDLTCEQFNGKKILDYKKAKKRMFLQTGCKGPSKRAIILAELMGYKHQNFD